MNNVVKDKPRSARAKKAPDDAAKKAEAAAAAKDTAAAEEEAAALAEKEKSAAGIKRTAATAGLRAGGATGDPVKVARVSVTPRDGQPDAVAAGQVSGWRGTPGLPQTIGLHTRNMGRREAMQRLLAEPAPGGAFTEPRDRARALQHRDRAPALQQQQQLAMEFDPVAMKGLLEEVF
jgi:hypothetical protein